jgi:hypothetical protein
MFLKPDLLQKEVDPPFNRWCASGHVAPLHQKNNNIIRFFLIEGHNISGTYCELCLIVANHIANQDKKR